jgi:membrane fusion protein, copper/silver efflux system
MKSLFLTYPTIVLVLCLFTACSQTEQEQQQQQQYQSDLMQQMIQSTEAFNEQLSDLLNRYFELKNALVETDPGSAAEAASQLAEEARSIRADDLSEESAMIWNGFSGQIITGAVEISRLNEADEQRIHFEQVSDAFILAVEAFQPAGYDVYVQSCPMVRGGSADWLSREEQIRNPYHGDRMMNCGEVLRRI